MKNKHFPWGWKKEWTRIVLLFVVMRMLYSLIGVVALQNPYQFPKSTEGPYIVADSILFHDSFSENFVNVWQRWDTGWYLKIAKIGFDSTDGSIAYSPLFPALIHVLGSISGNYLASALVITNLCTLLAYLLLYELACMNGMDKDQAFHSVLTLAVFPTAFFLFSGYTEALFLVLVLATIIAAQKKRWLTAGILGGLATLARHQGVFLPFVLLWIFLDFRIQADPTQPRLSLGQAYRLVTSREGWKRIFAALRDFHWLVLLLPFLVYAGYSAFIAARFGPIPEALEKFWGISAVAPWTGFYQFLQRLFTFPRITADYFDLGLLLIGVGMVAAQYRRMNHAFIIYSLLIWASLFMRGTTLHLLDSHSRYLLVIFPIFLAFGYIEKKVVRMAIWTVFLIIQMIFLYAFLSWAWIA